MEYLSYYVVLNLQRKTIKGIAVKNKNAPIPAVSDKKQKGNKLMQQLFPSYPASKARYVL